MKAVEKYHSKSKPEIANMSSTILLIPTWFPSVHTIKIAMNMVVLISYHLEGTITNPLGLGGVHP